MKIEEKNENKTFSEIMAEKEEKEVKEKDAEYKKNQDNKKKRPLNMDYCK